MERTETHVVLENIRSAQNVGAIFRTAEAIGVHKLWLVGYTPTPIDRFGRTQPDIAKTALGAENVVPWEHAPESVTLIERLHTEGVRIVAVERTENATDYKTCTLGVQTAFIFGNEIDGVSREVLESADEVISLPMRGMKESLNVATTAGIVLYRLLDR